MFRIDADLLREHALDISKIPFEVREQYVCKGNEWFSDIEKAKRTAVWTDLVLIKKCPRIHVVEDENIYVDEDGNGDYQIEIVAPNKDETVYEYLEVIHSDCPCMRVEFLDSVYSVFYSNAIDFRIKVIIIKTSFDSTESKVISKASIKHDNFAQWLEKILNHHISQEYEFSFGDEESIEENNKDVIGQMCIDSFVPPELPPVKVTKKDIQEKRAWPVVVGAHWPKSMIGLVISWVDTGDPDTCAVYVDGKLRPMMDTFLMGVDDTGNQYSNPVLEEIERMQSGQNIPLDYDVLTYPLKLLLQ